MGMCVCSHLYVPVFSDFVAHVLQWFKLVMHNVSEYICLPFPLLLTVQVSVCVCVFACTCTNMVYKECEGLKYTYFVFLDLGVLNRFSNIVSMSSNLLGQKGVVNLSNSCHFSYMQYI